MKYCDDINCCKNKDEEKYLYAFFDCAVMIIIIYLKIIFSVNGKN